MRSKNEWVDEWRDIPSLTGFKGSRNNFEFIGSVILESIDLVFDYCRYPQVAVWCNSILSQIFQIHLLATIIQYVVVRFSSCDAPGLESFIKSESNYV